MTVFFEKFSLHSSLLCVCVLIIYKDSFEISCFVLVLLRNSSKITTTDQGVNIFSKSHKELYVYPNQLYTVSGLRDI